MVDAPYDDDEIEAQPFTAEGAVNTKARRIRLLDVEELPPTYRMNTNKEDLCLEYVENFRTQFVQLFPKRKELILCPKNECKVRKFISTTVRATELPYRELYDSALCAEFVASLLEYEPLEYPTELPEYIPSSDSVLKWRVGDCFDFSILLASYLIGAGYDAYVVSGYAPKWVCLRDQSRTECPVLMVEELANSLAKELLIAGAPVDDNEDRYKVKDRGIPKSKFLKQQGEKAELEKARRAAEDEVDDEDEEEEEDPLEGERVHAWVLVRAGKREVKESFFIEPSTGRVYPVATSPYLGVESVWNNKNYWANMQEPEEGPMQISFDLSNNDNWEYVFIEPEGQRTEGDMGDGAEDDMMAMGEGGEDEGGEEEEDDSVLDIPPSWVIKLVIDRDMYAKRFCNQGQQTVLYHKAKLERFAENTHEQGMVTRLTIFKDRARTVPKEQREEFKNRRDKLERRVRYLLEGRVHEHFLPGRMPEALQDMYEWTGRKRELHYYTSARIDGLVKRVDEMGKKCMEYFEGRDDKLIYRSVSVTPDRDLTGGKTTYTLPGGQLGELVIHKMTEKFERDEKKAAEEDVKKRTYYVRTNQIREIYHYTTGRITSASRTYYKGGQQPPDIVEVDPSAPMPSEEKLEEESHKVQNAEKDCYQAVRHQELEKEELLKVRKREEASIIIDRSIFETAAENAKEDKRQELQHTEAEDTDVRKVDYLTPFLQNVQDVKKINREEGMKARDACLRALKERLLERANIIQTRLDEENSHLAKKQAAFQRSQRDHDQGGDEEFERFCSETMFRIQILEQRLTRHEETALQKYADMDQKLHTDPRLNVLNG